MSDTTKELIFQNEVTAGMIAERRTALISAAVTGKIDVRHRQPVGSLKGEVRRLKEELPLGNSRMELTTAASE